MSGAEEVQNAETRLSGLLKYSAVAAIMGLAFYLLKKKLQDISWQQLVEGVQNIPVSHLVWALALTVVNYLILTGYDLIAVRYMKKDLALRRVMTGAVVGYAMSNMFGWIFGGTAVRYRLYSSWGFTLVEIVAFVSILSLTFWLGMFLLAGVSFAVLPVKFPEEVREALIVDPHIWGWIFLSVVVIYLTASAFHFRPLRWGSHDFSLPPLRVSAMQLLVSAADFALASAVLYMLLPSGLTNFSTVLVAYLVAMIATVTLHVPGGFGVLEFVIVSLLPEDRKVEIVCALVVYRVIYYFLPAIVAGVLLGMNEVEMRGVKKLEESEKDSHAASTG